MLRNNRGIALGITLMIAIVLTIIGGVGLYLMTNEARTSRAVRLSEIALKAAEAGVERALARLKMGVEDNFEGNMTSGSMTCSYNVTVTREASGAYSIRSVGSYGGVTRTILVKARKEGGRSITQYAFFAKYKLWFNGSTVALSVKNKQDYVRLLQAFENGTINPHWGSDRLLEAVADFLGYLPFVKVGSGGDMKLTGSGDIGFDPDALNLSSSVEIEEDRNGYVESGGDIRITGSGNYGYVYASGEISTTGSVEIYQSEENADLSFPDFPPVDFDGQESAVAAAPDIRSAATLHPGIYGDLVLSGTRDVVTLVGSGTYYFKSIDISGGAKLIVDAGEDPVEIKVLDSLDVSGSGGIVGKDINDDTPDKILIEVAAQDKEDVGNSLSNPEASIFIHGTPTIQGVIYAPQANFKNTGTPDIIGSIIAQNIDSNGSGLWIYYEPLADLGQFGSGEGGMQIESWVVD